MATLTELQDLAHNNDLRGKIERAITITALAITKEVSPSAERLQWGSDGLANPDDQVQLMLNYVLAENSAATIAQITTATDSAIQTNVNDAVDALHS